MPNARKSAESSEVMVERDRTGRKLGAAADPSGAAEAAAGSRQDDPPQPPRPKNRTRVVRIMSPPMLPPQWGQAVAPPPTPHFTPHTSPRSAAATLQSDTQMEVYFDSDGGRQNPPPLVPNSSRDFGTVRSFDDVGIFDRQLHRQHSLARRHRRLRRVRSSASSISRCPNLCHQNCSDEHHHVNSLLHLRQQPDTVVYAYSFDGDVIDRHPLPQPTSHFVDGMSSHRRARTAADVIHGFHHPPLIQQEEQHDFLRGNQILSDFHFMRNRDVNESGASLLRCRNLIHHERRRFENESMTVEFHRSPHRHNSLSSSPQGGATTTTTGSGSVSPDVSPIVNMADNVTRLTTSPATPPSRRQNYGDQGQSVINQSRAVRMTSRGGVVMTRSAIRLPSSSRSQNPRTTKTVQWFSDLKKKPQDISEDRKIVKSQVENIGLESIYKINVVYNAKNFILTLSFLRLNRFYRSASWILLRFQERLFCSHYIFITKSWWF